jgi:hypothetical protein
MSRALSWALIIVGVALLVGLMAYARGDKHHHGDDVGTHGTKIVIVHTKG